MVHKRGPVNHLVQTNLKQDNGRSESVSWSRLLGLRTLKIIHQLDETLRWPWTEMTLNASTNFVYFESNRYQDFFRYVTKKSDSMYSVGWPDFWVCVEWTSFSLSQNPEPWARPCWTKTNCVHVKMNHLETIITRGRRNSKKVMYRVQYRKDELLWRKASVLKPRQLIRFRGETNLKSWI